MKINGCFALDDGTGLQSIEQILVKERAFWENATGGFRIAEPVRN